MNGSTRHARDAGEQVQSDVAADRQEAQRQRGGERVRHELAVNIGEPAAAGEPTPGPSGKQSVCGRVVERASDHLRQQ